jgi:hypothetical protein
MTGHRSGDDQKSVSAAIPSAFMLGMYVFISRGSSVFGVLWKIILTPSTSNSSMGWAQSGPSRRLSQPGRENGATNTPTLRLSWFASRP